MNKSRDGSKITLGMIKGKSINTSVPSIAIRFNANAEEIEELYQSEDEPVEKVNNEKIKPSGFPDPESSPLRYLPRLGKRCTSIDAALQSQDSSPPSDRWKFFTEIKGKITKSVEEIKQRNQETDNSLKKPKNTKDKDTSSLSDSDDLSESSISKTCGVVSTTEGVEMSTDDETPSLESDKKPKEILHNGTKHHRFRILRKKKTLKDEKIGTENLAELFEITTGSKPNILLNTRRMTNENVEVESGIEAFEDAQVPRSTSEENCTDSAHQPTQVTTVKEMLNNIVDHIENVEIDNNNVINVLPVSGSDIRHWNFKEDSNRIFLHPEGFVDLRPVAPSTTSWFNTVYTFRYFIPVFGIFVFYFFLTIPSYIYGFVIGILCTIIFKSIYSNYCEFSTERSHLNETFGNTDSMGKTIFEIPAIKEYHPIIKVEGWMNEYPDIYDPQTYHISQTQPVYIRLQGNFLRISHTSGKIPKRALWNEPKHKQILFSGHRIYSLIGAHICLLPEGLNRRRLWSKKYPICIRLNKDSLKFNSVESYDLDDQKNKSKENDADKNHKQQPTAKKKVLMQTQIFSKLTEEEENQDNDSEAGSKPSSSSIEISPDTSVTAAHIDEDNEECEDEDIFKEALLGDEDQEDDYSLWDWASFLPEDSLSTTNIYLFGRTDREKEDWLRRLISASHKEPTTASDIASSEKVCQQSVSDRVVTPQWNESEYLKYMNKYQKITIESKLDEQIVSAPNVSWINALISRVLFDCTRDPSFTNKVQERIQRKLSSIKLPYFIEQLSVGELSLGSNPPLIHQIGQPVLDQRGLWIDLGFRYEGNVVLKLQTKLNLMKLKQLPNSDIVSEESSFAKWQHSDVDDTAESSSDDEQFVIPSTGKVQDGTANASAPVGGTSNSSKKLMKMVDKITESKFFQAATENRYIKKAMEGVSNTDLCLKVELKGLVGTLVINMPPPPSDRMWIGFRPVPQLWLTAQPIVGERNISFIKHLTNWIEKKLSQEFQKVLVIPNMEDIVIPVMSSQLPT